MLTCIGAADAKAAEVADELERDGAERRFVEALRAASTRIAGECRRLSHPVDACGRQSGSKGDR